MFCEGYRCISLIFSGPQLIPHLSSHAQKQQSIWKRNCMMLQYSPEISTLILLSVAMTWCQWYLTNFSIIPSTLLKLVWQSIAASPKGDVCRNFVPFLYGSFILCVWSTLNISPQELDKLKMPQLSSKEYVCTCTQVALSPQLIANKLVWLSKTVILLLVILLQMLYSLERFFFLMNKIDITQRHYPEEHVEFTRYKWLLVQ